MTGLWCANGFIFDNVSVFLLKCVFGRAGRLLRYSMIAVVDGFGARWRSNNTSTYPWL